MIKKIYIAGPLFNKHEQMYLEDIAKELEGNGYDCFLPHRDQTGIDESELKGTDMSQETKDKIFKNDFILELAFDGGFVRQAVRTLTEGVLLLAADAVHLAQHLGGQAHHHSGFRGVLAGRGIDVNAVGHRHVFHVLDAADDVEIPHTGLDIGRGDMQRAHGRAAQAVDGLRRYRARNAGHDGGVTRNVHRLFKRLVNTAPNHVVDF